jgi:hypothetical protein
MIIGVNGRINSGKDTVGKIIQYLTDDTVSKTVYPKFEEFDKLDVGNEGYHPWQIKKFAGKLKQIASLLTGIPVEKFEDQEFKKLDMNSEWGMTYREFLQRLGTEAMRDGLHINVWANALFADYKHSKTCNCKKGCRCAHDLPNWIITDMRFPNEMEAVKERKGITIKVVRPCIECGGIGYHKISCSKQYQKEHPSETSLDTAEFDYKIINDGSIEDLVEKVREILIKENII